MVTETIPEIPLCPDTGKKRWAVLGWRSTVPWGSGLLLTKSGGVVDFRPWFIVSLAGTSTITGHMSGWSLKEAPEGYEFIDDGYPVHWDLDVSDVWLPVGSCYATTTILVGDPNWLGWPLRELK